MLQRQIFCDNAFVHFQLTLKHAFYMCHGLVFINEACPQNTHQHSSILQQPLKKELSVAFLALFSHVLSMRLGAAASGFHGDSASHLSPPLSPSRTWNRYHSIGFALTRRLDISVCFSSRGLSSATCCSTGSRVCKWLFFIFLFYFFMSRHKDALKPAPFKKTSRFPRQTSGKQEGSWGQRW